jgi:hypothetical protein
MMMTMLDALLAWFVVIVVGAAIMLGASWFAFCFYAVVRVPWLFMRRQWRRARKGGRGFDVLPPVK